VVSFAHGPREPRYRDTFRSGYFHHVNAYAGKKSTISG